MSTADKLLAKGRREGKAEGRTEGLTKGRADLVLGLLAARFGQLPQGTITRVGNASSADIDHWAVRILRPDTGRRLRRTLTQSTR